MSTPLQQEAQAQEAKGVERWQKIRVWSRTDSARWLNDRSAPVLAWLRRRAGQWPAHSAQVGYWLKDHAPEVFNHVHDKLTKLGSEAREGALPGEVLS
jgi:hypothetical protein